MFFYFINNYSTSLTAPLGDGVGDFEMDVATLDPEGDLEWTMPGDYVALTLSERGLDGTDIRREVVYAIGAADNRITVLRARENTTRQQWPVGTIVEARLTRDMMYNIPQYGDPALDPDRLGNWGIGSRRSMNLLVGPVDLLASPVWNITPPSPNRLLLDAIEIVISESSGAGGTPQFTVGTDAGSPGNILPTTGITKTAVGGREVHEPLIRDALTQLRIAVTSPGTGTTYRAWVVLRGYLLNF